MYYQNDNPYTERAVIIIDNDGKIMWFNTAAHDVCAALRVGKSIEMFMSESERAEYHRLRAESAYGFRLRTKKYKRRYDIVVDMKKDYSEGVSRVILDPLHVKKTEPLTYAAVADGVRQALEGKADAALMKHIYDAAVASDGILPEFSKKSALPFDETMRKFAYAINRKLILSKGKVILEKEPELTENAVIYAEPCGLFLTLAAIVFALESVSVDKCIKITLGDAKIRLMSNIRDEIYLPAAESFGRRAADVLFADEMSEFCGYDLIREIYFFDGKNRASFTLTLPNEVSQTLRSGIAVGLLIRRALEALEIYPA